MTSLSSVISALLLLTLCACASQGTANDIKPGTLLERAITAQGAPHKFAIWVPASYDASKPNPCVLFLHGSGECGTDGHKQTTVGLFPAATADPKQWACVIVMPQKPVESAEWEEYEPMVLAELAEARRELNIDPHRISLTGLSQGGHGTWIIGARHPDLFSALAPCCGYAHPNTVAPRIAGKPIWAFHGEKDDVVNPEETRRMVAEVKALHKAPEPRITLYPDLNHGCWDRAYRAEGLGQWLIAQKLP
ncbi:MAG: dienelactone hydrolase family protein [Acidobacteriota bacterium]